MSTIFFLRSTPACASARFGWVLIACIVLLATHHLAAATFTVTTTSDAGPGSLRLALLSANANANTDTIHFNIPGPIKTIAPLTPLPEISSPIIIDGSSQPGFAGKPLIEITGTNLGAVPGGLVISAGNSLVRSLAVNGFAWTASGLEGAGILLTNRGSNVIEGCYLGTDLTGTLSRSNYIGLVISDSAGNRIGGTTAAARNLISAGAYGLIVLGTNAFGNVLQGNFIGTDASGSNALGNQVGVLIGDASNNHIGGTTPGARNIISGNTYLGLAILRIIPASVTNSVTPSTNNIVEGNFIGTDVSGTRAVGNGSIAAAGGGILIRDASNNRIGGTAAGAGNLISGNYAWGVGAEHAHNNVFQGNFIGTDVSGTAVVSNYLVGIVLGNGTDNLIGGTDASARNLITGHGAIGVLLNYQCTNNFIQGNYIGTDVTGTVALTNGLLPAEELAMLGVFAGGISCVTSESTTIGGMTPGAGNLIAGSYLSGIAIDAGQRHVIQGNKIGVNAAGAGTLPNAGFGIILSGVSDTLIGGTNAEARNIISGNDSAGVFLGYSGSNNVIQGNFIGTDITGTQALGNGAVPLANLTGGVLMVDISSNANHSIGGTTPGAGNLISGNFSDGVVVSNFISFGSAVSIQGNLVGTDVTGTNTLGNAGAGVLVSDTHDVTIGGMGNGAGNTIAFNESAGVVIVGNLSFGDSIRRNRIFGNGGLGIDLGNDGPTANDSGNDADSGPNTLQNFPEITFAFVSGADTIVSGILDSAPFSTFRLEFFANPQGDSSGNGEGATFIGGRTFMTPGSGLVHFSTTFTNLALSNRCITATATSTNGDTSEFSPCVAVSGPAGSFQFSSTGYTVNESNGITRVTVTRANATAGSATVEVRATSGSAVAGADFLATNGILSFLVNEVSKTFEVIILQDTDSEFNETVTLTLQNPTDGATLGGMSQAQLTVVDDEPPTLSISDAELTESNSGFTNALFTVALSHPAGEIVTVNFATADSTATAGTDYLGTNGTIVFTPGTTNRLLAVRVRGETVDEVDETFLVDLSAPTNATLQRYQGRGQIDDDDGPVITMNDVTVTEGDRSPSNAVFIAQLSAPSPQRVSMNFATTTITALGEQDYRGTNGTLIFNPGETKHTIPVAVLPDVLNESTEAFSFNLSQPVDATLGDSRATGTILDNDPAPAVSIEDISFLEGNSNTTAAVFTLRLSRASGQNITVSYYGVNGTAVTPDDFAAVAGFTTFLVGQTERTVNISVVGDTNYEAHETFFLNLTNAVNATLSDTQAQATILDDERIPQLLSIRHLMNGRVAIECLGLDGLVYTLEGTTNFIDYVDVRAAQAPPGGRFQFVDTNAPLLNFHFYRVRAP